MVELPANIISLIRRYKSIEVFGLTIYPIEVAEYDDFLVARPAIGFLHQSLPAALMGKPLLQAYYEIEIGEMTKGNAPTGLLYRALAFLALSLRLGVGKTLEERVQMFKLVPKPNEPATLQCVRFDLRDGEEKEITPSIFGKLRPYLAAQNGIKIYSEDVTPELLDAENEVARQRSVDCDTSVDKLVSSVSALCGCDEDDVYSWPILKLEARSESLRLAMEYAVCKIAESNGATWKGGNPYPHPFFPKTESESSAHMSMDSFVGGEGLKAMQNSM